MTKFYIFACLLFSCAVSTVVPAKCRMDDTSQTCRKTCDANACSILNYKYAEAEVFGLAAMRFVNYGPQVAVQASFAKLPFLEAVFARNYPDMNSPVRPSKQLKVVDWPIVCFKEELEMGLQNAPGKNAQAIDARRVKIFDTLIFCGYDGERWGKGQSFTEYGRLPLLATCYMHEKTVAGERTRIVDLHLVSAVSDCNDAISHRKESSIVDLTLAHAFKYEKKPKQRIQEQWSAAAIPTFSIACGSTVQNERHFAILSTETVDLMLGSPGDPVLAGYLQSMSDTIERTEILRLPFIGPLWAKWNIKGKESHSGFVPAILNHASYQQSNKVRSTCSDKL